MPGCCAVPGIRKTLPLPSWAGRAFGRVVSFARIDSSGLRPGQLGSFLCMVPLLKQLPHETLAASLPAKLGATLMATLSPALQLASILQWLNLRLNSEPKGSGLESLAAVLESRKQVFRVAFVPQVRLGDTRY